MSSKIKDNTTSHHLQPAMRKSEWERLYEYLEETGVRIGHFVRKAIIEKLDRDEQKSSI